MLAYFLVILSSILYGVEPSIRALVLRGGTTPAAAMQVSSLVLLLLTSSTCLLRKSRLRVGRRAVAELLVMGGIGTWGTGVLLSSAYLLIPVGLATVIHFIYPSLVCLTMVLLFHSRLTGLKVWAMLCSVAGLLCICGIGKGGSLLGVLLAALSSFAYTFYVVMIEKGVTARLPLDVSLLYMSLGCLLFSLAGGPFLAIRHCWTPASLLEIVLCGSLVFLAAFSFAAGVKRVGASTAAFFSLFEPITSLVTSTLLYHDVFSLRSLFGIALSILSIVLVSLGNRRDSAPARPLK